MLQGRGRFVVHCFNSGEGGGLDQGGSNGWGCFLTTFLPLPTLVSPFLARVTNPQLSLTSSALSWVSEPCLFPHFIIIKQLGCDRLLIFIFILINFIFTCITRVSDIFSRVFTWWVICERQIFITGLIFGVACVGLDSGEMFAHFCLVLLLMKWDLTGFFLSPTTVKIITKLFSLIYLLISWQLYYCFTWEM